MTTMSYIEATNKIRAMQKAKDSYGNHLYDDMEIANYFGYGSIAQLNDVLAKARAEYREQLISNANVLQKAGKNTEEIAKIMNLTKETVEVLLDDGITKRLDKHKEVEKARREAFGNTQKEFDKVFRDLFHTN